MAGDLLDPESALLASCDGTWPNLGPMAMKAPHLHSYQIVPAHLLPQPVCADLLSHSEQQSLLGFNPQSSLIILAVI